MVSHRRHWLVMAAAVVALGVAGIPSGGALVGAGLRLRSDPDRLPADGRSQAVITVEAVGAGGMPVADGTPVHFVTTLGRVVSPVQTLGGLAQTTLTASRTAGVALVSAVVGSSRGALEVELVAVSGSAPAGSRLVEIRGGGSVREEGSSGPPVSYSPEKQVVIAQGAPGAANGLVGRNGGEGIEEAEQAELRYRELVIRADGLQYDVSKGVVCAQGAVSLARGERRLEGDALRYDLDMMEGRLVRVGDGLERMVVEGEKLETRPDEETENWLWAPLETDDTRTWVTAQRAIVDPGERVVLDHASFYVDGARVMSLRRSVLNPALGGAVFGNALGYSSGTGVNLDLPWYYRASGNRVGSLHITRNRTMSGAGDEIGWGLGLREEYFRGDNMAGAFGLDDVTEPRLGMRWEHRQRIGRASLSLDGSTVGFEEESPRFRTGSVNYMTPVGSGSLSASAARTDYGGSEQFNKLLSYRYRTMKRGPAVMVTPSLYLRQSGMRSPAGEVLIDTRTGEPLIVEDAGSNRSTAAGVAVDLRPAVLSLGRDTKLTSNLTAGYAQVLSGEGHGLFDLRLSCDHEFDTRNSVGLSYSLVSDPVGEETSLFSSGRQMLDVSTKLNIQEWTIRASASQELGGSRQYGSLNVMRPLPFGRDALGKPIWQVEGSHFFTSVENLSAAHTRMRLSRALGRYRLALCYSPQGVGDYDTRPWISASGYGYTYSGGRHIWLELSAFSY